VQGLWNRAAAQLASSWLKEQPKGETVVHLHSWTKALTTSVVRAALQQQAALVCTLHDYFSACPNGAFYLYPKQALCTLRPLSIQCTLENCDARSYSHKLWRLARGVVQQTVGRFPSPLVTFIAISRFSQRILAPYLPSNATIHLLPNPVNIPQSRPVPVEANQAYTFLGRLSPEKGAAILAQANRDLGLPLVYVGDGPCREEITSLAPDAHITGWLDSSRVTKWLDKTRALVFPSNVYETQGLAVMEAAARGVPAVVSSTCAARDFVKDGETGLWFSRGDINDLREKLLLLQSDDLAADLGQAAYDRYWSAPATPQAHIQGLVKIYEEILSNTRAAQFPV
jgi:glycosyltransferase involved in cell wall biosynthesis